MFEEEDFPVRLDVGFRQPISVVSLAVAKMRSWLASPTTTAKEVPKVNEIAKEEEMPLLDRSKQQVQYNTT